MKTKYLKRILALSLTALLFNSCLKDDAHVFNAETVPNVVQFFNAGLPNFGADAVTGSGLDTTTFAVGVTAANPPTTSTSVKLAVDTTLMNAYNAAHPNIVYHSIPPAAYKLPANVVIPAGKNNITTTVIIDKTQLDPSLSYMLPVVIAGSSPSLPIATNLHVHYFHIIGNDFAGPYLYDYLRYNNGVGPSVGPPSTTILNTPVILSPVSPTQFEMATTYVGPVKYEVTFTKGGTASAPTYSNWAVTFNATDVQNYWTANGISIVNQPTIIIADPVNKVFEFNYTVFNGAANRFIDDKYHAH
jgi:hypothetical protein